MVSGNGQGDKTGKMKMENSAATGGALTGGWNAGPTKRE